MKRILSFLLFLLAYSVKSQVALFVNTKNALHVRYPDLDLEDKLLAINVWSSTNEQSKDGNTAFAKAYAVYHEAILKGGRHGILVVAVRTEKDKAAMNGLLELDAAEIKMEDMEPSYNVVFDATGREIYSKLPGQSIYPAIQKLITR